MVGKELAVENPLAREIVNACGRLRLETLFEPAKCHPRDWANPGRVKVKLRGGNNSSIKNSMCFPLLVDVDSLIRKRVLKTSIYQGRNLYVKR